MGCACCDAGILSRRGVLTGASALGLLRRAWGAEKPTRIDVHHHIAPPAWVLIVLTIVIGLQVLVVGMAMLLPMTKFIHNYLGS